MPFLDKLQKTTLYIFFFSINFEMLSPFSGIEDFSMSKLTGILYLLTILPQYKLFFRTDHIKRFLVPLFIFFAFETFINLININDISSEVIDSSLLFNIIFFLIMVNHERKEYMIIERAMLAFAIGAVVLTIFYIAGIGVVYEKGGRLSIFGDDQNYIGFRISIAILIFLFTVFQNRLKLDWSRYLFLLAIPIMLKLLIETGSRGAFISFILTLIIGITFFKTKRLWGKIFVIVVGILLITAIGTYVLNSEMMSERLQETVDSGDTGGRAAIWKNLLGIIKEHPIVGIGKTGYIYETTLLYGKEESPHNVILEILCYTGIVGLMFYLYFLYQIGIISYTIYKRTSFLLPILLIIPIFGMILSIQILARKIGWIIFAYIISASAIQRNQTEY